MGPPKILPKDPSRTPSVAKPKAVKPTKGALSSMSKTTGRGEVSNAADKARDHANVLQGLDIDEDSLDFVMEQIQDVLTRKKVRAAVRMHAHSMRTLRARRRVLCIDVLMRETSATPLIERTIALQVRVKELFLQMDDDGEAHARKSS